MCLSLARERPDMIFGVFVRDVDSGNAEREPIDDPTGWRVIGAAGRGPSKNFLTPIENDNSTANSPSRDRTTSIHSNSNFSSPQAGMNFMSNAHLEFSEEGEEGSNTLRLSERTPRPNVFVFQREGTLLVDENSYAEPESLTTDLGRNSTTSASKTTRSQSYPVERSHRLYQQMEKPLLPPPPPPPSLLQNRYVTQLDHPSLHNHFPIEKIRTTRFFICIHV